MVRGLQQRYLTPGGPLELPADTKFRLSLAGKKSGKIDDIQAIQEMLAENLRCYWYPRFLLHHSQKQSSKGHIRPHTSLGILIHSVSNQSCPVNYPRVLTPLLPLKTPTFCRVTRRDQRKSGISSREFVQRITRPNSSSTSTSHFCVHHDSDYLSDGGKKILQPGSDSLQRVSEAVERVSSSNRMATKGSLTDCNVLKDSSIIFQRESSKCSSLPYLLDKRGASDSRLSNKSRTNLEPVKQYKDGSNHGSISMLPQSLRQSYTPSPIPNLQQDTIPPTGSSGYHKLTGYTARHLPHPSSSRVVTPCTSSVPPLHILSVSGTPLLPPTHHTPSPTSCMVECLASEYRNAGGYFEEYLKSLSSQVRLHCLLFWRDVQEFKSLFVSPSFHPPTVQAKAKALYGRYVVESCPTPLSLPPSFPAQVSSRLCPPYDDLFDEVEDHILHVLLEQWEIVKVQEKLKFQKMDTLSFSRIGSASRIRAPSAVSYTALDELTEEFAVDEAVRNDLLPFSSQQTPQYTPYLSHIHSPQPYNIPNHSPSPLNTVVPSQSMMTPSPRRAVGLNDIVSDPNELEHFKMFLNERKAAKHLMCWMEIEAFRGIPSKERHLRDLRARQLREKYFTRQYLLGPKSPAGREAQRQIVAAGGHNRLPSRPKTPVFREAQKHVQAKLEKKWLAEFLDTPEYKAHSGLATERDEQEEEGRGRRRVTVNSDLRFAQSHEALLLRKALQKESSRELFLSFLSFRGTSDTNCRADVEFWLEVQRYKGICHSHTNKIVLSDKLKAMKECYLNSSVPPKLHIDIPQHMADAILNKDVGPYVFREAQTTVFRHLYSYWQEYQLMCHNLTSSTEISAEIEKTKIKMEQLRKGMKEKEREIKEQRLRFETAAEREERMKREREEREFGEVAVNFTLVKQHPQYIYHTVS
jgi:hypothetical protein